MKLFKRASRTRPTLAEGEAREPGPHGVTLAMRHIRPKRPTVIHEHGLAVKAPGGYFVKPGGLRPYVDPAPSRNRSLRGKARRKARQRRPMSAQTSGPGSAPVDVRASGSEPAMSGPERQPTGFANYKGDCRGILTEGPKGPNYMGEFMWPVTATYDAEADRTRVGFSLQAPPS